MSKNPVGLDGISSHLVRARQRLYLSRKEVIGRLARSGYRVSATSLGEYERGDVQPPPLFISAFCRTLRISPTWILWGEGPMAYQEPEIMALVWELLHEATSSAIPPEELRNRLVVALEIVRGEGGLTQTDEHVPLARTDSAS